MTKTGAGLAGGFPVSTRSTFDRHVIRDISYERDQILCACGWEGSASADRFSEHRKAVGAVKVKGGANGR